ncbi:MAG: nitrate ABC transporter, permease protein [Gemmatimonadales bacterium]|nr:MAG: nitrate ABC transporter, permease protein [Gemmatimonadales bacterium]
MSHIVPGRRGARAGAPYLRPLLPLVGFALLLALWWFAATFLTNLMPGPITALRANLDYLANPFHVRGPGDIGVGFLLLQSLQRVLIGFALGSVVAIPLGFLIGLSPLARSMFDPLVQVLKPVSPVAWLPVALAVFNLANPSAIFVIFITSLWPTVINTAVGVAGVPKDYLAVARVVEMPRWKQIVRIVLPAALPYIFTGLRISLGIAWLVIVAVEMLTGGQGIGFFVWDEWNRLNLSAVFLAILLIGLTGLLLDLAIGRIQAAFTWAPEG